MSGHICKRCGGGIPTDELLVTPRGAWHEGCYLAAIYELRERGVALAERKA